MKYLPTSLYLTCRPFRSPGQWGEVHSYKKTFEDPRRDDHIMRPGSQQARRCPWGGVKRRDSADIADIVPLEARECTCGGRGGRAQMPGYLYALIEVELWCFG